MRVFGILGVVIVLCVGFFLYQRSMADLPEGSPQEQIDTAAIRQRLLTIAQTERQYQASNGKYATLEQLAGDNLLPGGTEQRGYTFTASIIGTGFTITATPTADDKAGLADARDHRDDAGRRRNDARARDAARPRSASARRNRTHRATICRSRIARRATGVSCPPA